MRLYSTLRTETTKVTFPTPSYPCHSFLPALKAYVIMNASINKPCNSLSKKPEYKSEESSLDNGKHGSTEAPHTLMEGRPSKCNEKGVYSESEEYGPYQEQEGSPRELPLTIVPGKESSAKESGNEDRKSSNRSAQSLEQAKDQIGSPATAPELQPSRPQTLPLLIIGISLSVFLVSLDRTIITTVGPPLRVYSTGRCPPDEARRSLT